MGESRETVDEAASGAGGQEYIGARGRGGSQWETITRIVAWQPSDATERTADARGGRAAWVRDPEAAGGGGVAGRTRVFVSFGRFHVGKRALSGSPLGSMTCPSTACQCLFDSRYSPLLSSENQLCIVCP